MKMKPLQFDKPFIGEKFKITVILYTMVVPITVHLLTRVSCLVVGLLGSVACDCTVASRLHCKLVCRLRGFPKEYSNTFCNAKFLRYNIFR